jgi:hypothetical protein
MGMTSGGRQVKTLELGARMQLSVEFSPEPAPACQLSPH